MIIYVFQILFAAVLMLVIPGVLGFCSRPLFPAPASRSIFSDIVMGTFLTWGVYLLLCLPCILLRARLTTLNALFIASVTSMIAAGLYFARDKNFIRVWSGDISSFVRGGTLLTLVIAAGFAGISLIPLFLQTPNADDYDFVAMSVSAVQTNSVMRYDTVTALEITSFSFRRLLAPYPILLATYSSFLGLHPAIFSHSVYPVFITIVCACEYHQLAERLFNGDRDRMDTFLILLLAMIGFGGYSSRTLGSMLLLRAWQGKAMILSLVLPVLWSILMDFTSQPADRRLVAELAAVSLGAALISVSADMIITGFAAGFALVILFQRRGARQLAALCAGLIPSLAMVLAYLCDSIFR